MFSVCILCMYIVTRQCDQPLLALLPDMTSGPSRKSIDFCAPGRLCSIAVHRRCPVLGSSNTSVYFLLVWDVSHMSARICCRRMRMHQVQVTWEKWLPSGAASQHLYYTYYICGYIKHVRWYTYVLQCHKPSSQPVTMSTSGCSRW